MELFRPIAPASLPDRHESFTDASSGIASAREPGRRTRRLHERPVLVACTECRRARAKCNGKPPATCDRCHMRAYTTCVYPPHTKLQKDDILQELAQAKSRCQVLEQRNHDLSTILDIVTRQGLCQDLKTRLLAGEDTGTILTWLSARSETYSQTRCAKGIDINIENTINNILRVHKIHSPIITGQRSQWTSVTSNAAFLDYLVSLYLDNTNADFLLFSTERFIQSYIHGESDACSASLLNAICLMACEFLNSKLSAPEDRIDVTIIRSAFMQEALSSIELASSRGLAVIQSMSILCLAHLSDAQARKASTWLKVAAESLRDLDAETQMSADFDMTRWTIYSLDALWSTCSSQNPYSQMSYSTVTFDSPSNVQLFQSEEPSFTSFYGRYLGTSLTAIHAAAFRARLCKICQSISDTYCGTYGLIKAEMITSIRGEMLALLENAPACLKDTSSIQIDPCLQSLYIAYYGTAARLWSPLVLFAQTQQNQDLLKSFQDLLLENSRNAFKHIEYWLTAPQQREFLPPNLVYVVNICDSIARWTSRKEERFHVLHCCLKLLKSNTSSPNLCRVLMKLLLEEMHKFVEEKMIAELQSMFKIPGTCSVEEALDATTRLTYVSPSPAVTNWLSPDFASHWLNMVAREAAITNSGHAMRIKDICN